MRGRLKTRDWKRRDQNCRGGNWKTRDKACMDSQMLLYTLLFNYSLSDTRSVSIYIIKVQTTASDHVGQLAAAGPGRNRVDITACSVQFSAVTEYARWSVRSSTDYTVQLYRVHTPALAMQFQHAVHPSHTHARAPYTG